MNPVKLEAAMRLAVEQANRVKGGTYPNPPVGAVILDRDGDVAGVGATEPTGGPHAEVVALRRAGERAAGGATELLMDAHVELDRRNARHQRQTRVLFLLRKLLDRNAAGMEPTELAVEIVRTLRALLSHQPVETRGVLLEPTLAIRESS